MRDERQRPGPVPHLELERVGSVAVDRCVPSGQCRADVLGERRFHRSGSHADRRGRLVVDEAVLADLDMALPSPGSLGLGVDVGPFLTQRSDDL